MKFYFSILVLLAISLGGYAQVVENFEVGPYEVDYKGDGDYKFRLRKGVDLYEYFGLKKDTTIVVTEKTATPIKHAIQVNAFLSIPRYLDNGTSNVWGIDGSWKQKIGNKLYYNAGLSLGLLFGKYGEVYSYYQDSENGKYKETIFEIGIPLSIEWTNLNDKKAALYGGIGLVPTIYFGAKNAVGDSKSGLLIGPRLDLGGYLPIGKTLVRLGGFAQYNFNCASGEDLFKERIGRFFIGANVGLLF